ncbi:MAG: hypothetical protein AAFX06_33165 [Planctomycetota bacterium]
MRSRAFRVLSASALLIFGCVLAGLYGAAHNQVSWSISSEYFTKFKFVQFNITYALETRSGASIVGFMASWWMGLLIGGLLLPLGMIIRETGSYVWCMLRVYAIVFATTLFVGLLSLVASFVLIDPANVRRITVFGNQIEDSAAFLRAATMHNFGYVGGFVGILTGASEIVRTFLQDERRRNTKT